MNLQNSNSIKILILTNSHRADDTRVYDKIACSLAQKYKMVYVHNQISSNHSPNIEFISLKKSSNFLFIIQALKLIVSIKPSIIILVEPITLIIAMLCKTFMIKAKCIYDCHEFYAEAFTERFTRFKKIAYFFYRTLEQFLVRFVDAVITVNELLDHEFSNHKNRYIISNYPRQREIPISAKEFDVLYIGGLSIDRGISLLINAIQNLKDQGIIIKTLIIGKFLSVKDQITIHDLIKNSQLTHEVIIKEFVPYSLIGEYISKAKIGISLLNPECHRYQKALPLKLIEYLQYSLPAICNNFPIVRNVIETNHCGLCINYELEELSSAIKNLLDNEALYLEYSQNALRTFNSSYHWESEQDKLFECIEKLLHD